MLRCEQTNTSLLCSHLGVVANDLLTFLAGVGVQAVVAGDAVRFLLHLDVLASVQGLVTVSAVEAVAHGVFLWTREQVRGETEKQRKYFILTAPKRFLHSRYKDPGSV